MTMCGERVGPFWRRLPVLTASGDQAKCSGQPKPHVLANTWGF
jgi:hypothetical protein